MKQLLSVIFMALPCFVFSQYTYDKLQVNYLETEPDAKTFTYGNLRLYPIRAKDDFKKQFKDIGKYMTLKEAIDSKKVKITEKGEGESVNNLTIENVSQDTIIVITGEIIKGGKQDRIINKDMLLKPKSGKVNLPVFCVESGRWTYKRSSNDDFATHYNVGTMSLRKVVEKEKDQSKVWSKVDEINTKNNTKTSTSTYTALTNSTEFKNKLKEYVAFFRNKFAAEKDVIGVVVVSGDKVLGCDMFATSELFNKNFENLLYSYATEAILNGKAVTIKPANVKLYTDSLLSSEQRQEVTIKQKGNSFVEKGKKLRVSSFE